MDWGFGFVNFVFVRGFIYVVEFCECFCVSCQCFKLSLSGYNPYR